MSTNRRVHDLLATCVQGQSGATPASAPPGYTALQERCCALWPHNLAPYGPKCATPASDGGGLKACPFCGWSDPVVRFDAAGPDEAPDLNSGYVQCLECGTFGPDADTEAGGIAAWNRRSVPPAPDLNAIAEEMAKDLQCREPGRGGRYYNDDVAEFRAILQRHFAGRS